MNKRTEKKPREDGPENPGNLFTHGREDDPLHREMPDPDDARARSSEVEAPDALTRDSEGSEDGDGNEEDDGDSPEE